MYDFTQSKLSNISVNKIIDTYRQITKKYLMTCRAWQINNGPVNIYGIYAVFIFKRLFHLV